MTGPLSNPRSRTLKKFIERGQETVFLVGDIQDHQDDDKQQVHEHDFFDVGPGLFILLLKLGMLVLVVLGHISIMHYMLDSLNNPYLALVSLLSSVIALSLLVIFYRQFGRYRELQADLLEGEDLGSLSEIVGRHKKTLAAHNKNLTELGRILEEIVENNKLNIKHVGVVRFNPFADAGSNMSFVVALLDGDEHGIVISSLHSREGTRIYAKPIENSSSSYHLTSEEVEAINSAKIKNQNEK